MHTKYASLLIRTPKETIEKQIHSHCLNTLLIYTRTDRIIIDARRKLTPENPRNFIVFMSNNGKHPGNWVKHYIATDRAKILNTKSPSPNTFQTCRFLYGKLSFSRNGNKITAYAPIKNDADKFIRISTDIEVLKHTVNYPCTGYYAIYWYYDP